jgi:molecular chaperone GrpE (heat shock protein)
MAETGEPEYEVLSNCTLLMLNRWVGCQTGTWYYPEDVFSKSVDIWNGTPIVFGQVHPDPKLFKADPEAALKEVGGEIIGYISDSRVVIEGHPRHVAAMNIDPVKGKAAIDLYHAGRFGISGAEFFSQSEGVITEITEASHVLVFEEDGWTMPADLGAVAAKTSVQYGFSNSPAAKQAAVRNTKTDDLEPLFNRFFDRVKGLFSGSGEVQAAMKEQKQETVEMSETSETQVAALNQQIATLENERATIQSQYDQLNAEYTALKEQAERTTAKLEELTAKFVEQETAQKDAAFTAFLDKHVPIGEKSSEEQIAGLKTAFMEKDPALFDKVAEWKENALKASTKTGIKFATKTGDEKPVRRYSDLFHKGA